MGIGVTFVDNLIDRWNAYRTEDAHEVNLYAIRVNAMLTCQGVLVAAVAFMGDKDAWTRCLALGVAFLGLRTCYLSLRAIKAGCTVMDMWHKRGRELLGENEKADNRPLDGLHLEREQPDFLHRRSIDEFGVGMGSAFYVFWLATIGWLVLRIFLRS
jgi:hypothetical protein